MQHPRDWGLLGAGLWERHAHSSCAPQPHTRAQPVPGPGAPGPPLQHRVCGWGHHHCKQELGGDPVSCQGITTWWVWRGAHSAITAGSTGKRPHALGLSQLQGRASCRRPNRYTLQVSTQRAALGTGQHIHSPALGTGQQVHPHSPCPARSMAQLQSPRLRSPLQSPRLAPAPAAATALPAPLLQQYQTQPRRLHASSPLSPPRAGEPGVTFKSPAQSPALPHHRSESALTSKNWGASACAWLAMPMGQAVPFAHTS